MSLTTKIFRIFTWIFLAQLFIVGSVGIGLFSSTQEQLPISVIQNLTNIDRSTLEGIVLQNQIGNSIARDLVAYKLLELNSVDSAEFIEPNDLENLKLSLMLEDCGLIQDVSICYKGNKNVAVSLIPLRFGERLEGYLKLEKSIRSVDEVNKKLLFTIGLTVFVVFVINILSLLLFWNKFLRPETQKLTRAFNDKKEDPSLIISEFKDIQRSFLDALEKIEGSEAEKLQLQTQVEKMNLSAQVAHDIRSPLEVLKGLKDDLRPLPEHSRRRLQLSINRIEEIAYNLLKAHRKVNDIQKFERPEELLSLVESVILEKRIEFRSRPNIKIETEFSSESFGLFSIFNRGSLKTILSNIINNAFEAFTDRPGVISIGLASRDGHNIITIEDNGPGIPQNIQSKIFEKGLTTKEEGNGLGLFHASNEIKSSGGYIEVNSIEGKGATFIVALPMSERPQTFIKEIKTYLYKKIIVLDDDLSFHEIWNAKLSGLSIPIENYYSSAELLDKYKSLDSNILLLSDFETLEDGLNGIETILALDHASHSVLVTARFEEFSIQKQCIDEGIKLLPKSMISYLRVESTAPQIILIDDDKLAHISWKQFLEERNVDLRCFYSVSEFLDEASSLDFESKIFIDSNLGEGIKGEVESLKIFDLGFRNLYISTGYNKNNILRPHWILNIYPKSPEDILAQF